MLARIQIRRDSKVNWEDTNGGNPVLHVGEIGYDTTTKKFKIGDGETNWNNLPYQLGQWDGEVNGDISFGYGNVNIANNLQIDGNLFVKGTTTTVNTKEVTFNDRMLTLNWNENPIKHYDSSLISGIDVNIGWPDTAFDPTDSGAGFTEVSDYDSTNNETVITLSSALNNFPTTYKDNYVIYFSDNVSPFEDPDLAFYIKSYDSNTNELTVVGDASAVPNTKDFEIHNVIRQLYWKNADAAWYVDGNKIWHEGNLNINSLSYLPLSGGTLTGNLDVEGEINFSGTRGSFVSSLSQPRIYRSGSESGTYPFDDFGHLILQTRTDGSNRDIVFATGTDGANLTVIKSDGKVGIGETDPNTKLHVVDTNEIVATLTNSTNSDLTKTLLRFSQNVDSDNVSGNIGINRLGANAGCGFEINLADGAGNQQNRLTILENGRVGIGTTSPSKKLEVAGDLQLDASSASIYLKSGAATTAGKIYWTYNSDTTIYNSFGIAYDSRTTLGMHLNSGYPITLDCAGGTYIDFSVDGTAKMRMSSNGNFGIGATNPSAPLHAVVPSTSAGGTYVGVFENLSSEDGSQHGVKIIVEPNGGYPLAISNDGGATNNCFSILNNGRVGIGTLPSYELHVRKDQNARTNLVLQNFNTGTSADAQIFVETKEGAGDPQLQFQIDGKEAYTLGIDNSDSDKFKISDYGSLGTNDRLTIDSSGNVGIGNSNPSQLLQVGGDKRGQIYIKGTDSASPTLTLDHTSYTNGRKWALYSGGARAANFDIYDLSTTPNATPRFSIDENGKVGIGTTSPDELLHLEKLTDGVNEGNPGIVLENSDQKWAIFNRGSSSDRFQINDMTDPNATTAPFRIFPGAPTDSIHISSTGKVGIGVTNPVDKFEVEVHTGEALRIVNPAGTMRGYFGRKVSGEGHFGIFDASSNERIHLDTTAHSFFTGAGNVGIGTTSPTEKLHVYTDTSMDHILIDGTDGIHRGLGYASNGVRRWNLYTDSNAETGSNNGSNFRIARYHDNGSYLGLGMEIERSSGNVGIGVGAASEKLQVAGAIKLGTTSNNNSGTIRYNTTTNDFEGNTDGTSGGWTSLTSGGSSTTQTQWTLTANGTSSDYIFSGPGIESGNTNDPDIFLVRGQTYKFDNQSGGHPFEIRTSPGSTAYSDGVSQSGTITTFTVPMNAPSLLYYQCTSHSSMLGNIYISSNELQQGWKTLGSTNYDSSTSPQYDYKFYRVTDDITYDFNRVYEVIVDADDNAGMVAIYHLYLSSHGSTGNHDRIMMSHVSGRPTMMRVVLDSNEHVWIAATNKWGVIRIRGLHENEDVSSMPFADSQLSSISSPQFNETAQFIWNGDTNEITLLPTATLDGKLGIGTSSPGTNLQVKKVSTNAYSNGNVNVSDSILSIFNNPSSEVTNSHATMQFSVYGGTHNRVGGISLVGQSASTRKADLAFWTDDASQRIEKMRITGDGSIKILDGTVLAPDCVVIGAEGSNGTSNQILETWTYTNSANDQFTITPRNTILIGDTNFRVGRYAYALGGFNEPTGYQSISLGHFNKSLGNRSICIGSYCESGGELTPNSNSSLGYDHNGDYAISMGYKMNTRGENSFGISLNQPSTDYELTQANTMAIMGGKVGIGTTSPTSPLEVMTGGDTSSDGIILRSSSAGGRTLRLWATGDKAHIDSGGGGEDLILNNAGGKVGIGTGSPSAPLHIKSPTDQILKLQTSDQATNGPVYMGFYDSADAQKGWFGYGSNLNEDVSIWNTEAGAVKFATSNTQRMIIQSNGNVGIGVSSTNHHLGVYGNIMSYTNTAGTQIACQIGVSSGAGLFRVFDSTGSSNSDVVFKADGSIKRVGILTNSPSQQLHVVGNILATGTVTENSDITLKENLEVIKDPIEKVKQINGYTYNMINNEEEKMVGLVAQEVEEILPELIFEDDDGIKSLAYGHVVALLVECIKKQDERIESQDEKINDLEKIIQELS